MAMVGYARVSTSDQDNSLQISALKKAGCTKLFDEKQSGTSTNKRTSLSECLSYLREGDTLVVTRIDRLARNLCDLQNLVHDLKAKGIDLKATALEKADQVHDLVEQGKTRQAIADELGIGVASVYRILNSKNIG